MAASTCYGCGESGHFERDCPNNAYVGNDGKPPWCGICDERTRLIDQGDRMVHCRNCHPHRNRQLPQHKKCSACHMTVFAWDQSPCGKHHAPQAAINAGWNP